MREISSMPYRLPWLPPGEIVQVADRGEFFVRHHRHPDPSAPTVLLLHGWTASADLQYFTAYRALAERCRSSRSTTAATAAGCARRSRSVSRTPRTTRRRCCTRSGSTECRHRRVLDGRSGLDAPRPPASRAGRRHGAAGDGAGVQRNKARAPHLAVAAGVRSGHPFVGVPAVAAARRPAHDPRWPPMGRYVPWLLGEIQRGNAHALVDAGKALRHHDARPWAGSLGIPAAVLLTTRDHLVRPASSGPWRPRSMPTCTSSSPITSAPSTSRRRTPAPPSSSSTTWSAGAVSGSRRASRVAS
jgi:3-oxoadipate enol-lactonase